MLLAGDDIMCKASYYKETFTLECPLLLKHVFEDAVYKKTANVCMQVQRQCLHFISWLGAKTLSILVHFPQCIECFCSKPS